MGKAATTEDAWDRYQSGLALFGRRCDESAESCWLGFHCGDCLSWVDLIHDYVEVGDGAEDIA